MMCNLCERIRSDPRTVPKVFKSMHTSEVVGPDGLSVFPLKTFAQELSTALHPLFQLPTDTYSASTLEKVYYRPSSPKAHFPGK